MFNFDTYFFYQLSHEIQAVFQVPHAMHNNNRLIAIARHKQKKRKSPKVSNLHRNWNKRWIYVLVYGSSSSSFFFCKVLECTFSEFAVPATGSLFWSISWLSFEVAKTCIIVFINEYNYFYHFFTYYNNFYYYWLHLFLSLPYHRYYCYCYYHWHYYH